MASSDGSAHNEQNNRGKGPALSDWSLSNAKIALREVGIRNSSTRFPIQELPFNNTDCASNTQAMLSLLLSVLTPPSELVKEAPRTDYVSAILFAIAKEVRLRIDRERRFFFMCGRMPASGAEEFVFVFPTSRGEVVVGGCECRGSTAISKHGQSLMEIAGMTMSNSRFFTRLPIFNIETDGIEWVGRISLPTLPSDAEGMQMKVCKFYLESALDYKNPAQVFALQRKVHYLFRYCVDYAVHELCARDSALFDELRAADYPSVSPLRLNALVLDQAPSVDWCRSVWRVCRILPFSSLRTHLWSVIWRSFLERGGVKRVKRE